MGAVQSASGVRCCATLPLIEDRPDMTYEDSYVDGTNKDALSVMQFTCETYYCQENEEEMQVDVVRFGDCRARAVCDYTTEDATAKAGTHYRPAVGRLLFEAGESMQSLLIPIISSGDWSATVEFGMVLSHAEGAHLGKYLYRTSIKIIDEDFWPSSKIRDSYLPDSFSDHDFAMIPGLPLLWEYIRLVLRERAVYVDTIQCLLLDQVANLHFFLILYLQLYMVDVVLAIGDEGKSREGAEWSLVPEVLIFPGNRKKTAIVVAVLYFVPFLFTYLIGQRKCKLCIPGNARKHIQTNVMLKYLHCREHIRTSIPQSKLTMASIRDVMEVVDMGFMKLLEVIRSCGKLGLALIFILVENRMAAIPLVVYPIILGIWFEIREKKTHAAIEEKAEKQDAIVAKIDEAVTNIRLIADFALKDETADRFARIVDSYHDAESEACAVEHTTVFMAPALTIAFVSGFMALSVSLVTGIGDGDLFGVHVSTISLGTFLATINVFKEVGAELEEIFKIACEIQMSFGPLRAITRLMNTEDDLLLRRAINRRRRQEGRKQRLSAREKASADETVKFPVDLVKLRISNLHFDYGHGQSAGRRLFSGASAEFAQGKLYAFIGPPGDGKSTLLRLLGQIHVPANSESEIFVPPHLRILHADAGVMVLRASFLENILLKRTLHSAGGLKRIKQICLYAGFKDEVVAELEKESSPEVHRDLSWMSLLSMTDYARLNLARVLVVNPEVLVMHKPAMPFSDLERPSIIKLLKKHVLQKGLELSSDEFALRRPRTVFLTSNSLAECLEAEQVFHVSKAEGLREIHRGELEEAKLHCLSY